MVYENFPSVVAIFDQDLDGDLDCVQSVRTYLDPEAHEATYVWILKGLNGMKPENLTFHLKPGATADTSVFTMDNDNTEQTLDFLYTDYKDCLVVKIPYKGEEQCMLWVADARKDDIPQSCVDYYEDNCDAEKTSYLKDAQGRTAHLLSFGRYMAAIVLAMSIPMLALQFLLPLSCHAVNPQSQPDVVDAFKALAAFPYAVAMADTDDSGDLDCMITHRTKFSKQPPRFGAVSCWCAMEVEPYGRLPDTGMTSGVASRKRYSSESGTDSDDTEPYYVSSDESGDDNLKLVGNHKGKRLFEHVTQFE
ncbi:hypothetical protein HPB51_018960 [Rhipicephalus microplus]|uniref:Uncharacterized protein n=1 Tax=Rhipicephalus microplus TaxID=6941 RepID=A0A9J6D771_RHIMP|nr:hypothetical protein HPB51_018960 [Rhipicephalus microplus]